MIIPGGKTSQLKVLDAGVTKKTSSFKHAAWSKDSILCFWRDTIFCAICSTLKAARTCCVVNVLTWRISFLFSWPWWMRCVVKHNMLKFRTLSVQPGLRGSNDLRVGRKNGDFQFFFQSREQVLFRRGQIRRTEWVIKTLEAQVGQFLLGCKCPVSRGIVVQEQDHFG